MLIAILDTLDKHLYDVTDLGSNLYTQMLLPEKALYLHLGHICSNGGISDTRDLNVPFDFE